jgi:transposase
MVKVGGLTATGEDNMNDVTIIGVDLAKRVFHAHGSHSDGSVAFRKRLSRSQVLTFFAKQPRCTVAMEACATAHEWGRAIGELGHEIRLIPPAYVKPFVKRQKNDTSDAEAIAEAAARPTMRFVAVKTEEQQARSMIFRTRDLLVRQRTQLINALRGHLAEHGVIAPHGPANVRLLAAALNDADRSLQSLVRDIGAVYLEQIMAKLVILKRFFDARLSVEPTHHACRQCQALARSPQWRSRPLRRPCRPSSVAATLLLG